MKSIPRASLIACCVPALLALVLLAGMGSRAGASGDDFRYLLRTESRSLIPPAGETSAAVRYLAERQAQGSGHLLVQMLEIPAAEARADLGRRGLVLQGYLPERTYYALARAALSAEDLRSMGVRWCAPLTRGDKLSPRVRRGDFGPWTEYSGGLRVLAVQFHDDIAPAAADRALAAFSGEMGGWIQSTHIRVIALDPARVPDLAALDEVKYIDQIPPPLSQVNDGIRMALSVNSLFQAPYGLSGDGASVLVYDAGMVSSSHPDFSPGRVTLGESGNVSTHSTHVAGTVGGNGSASGGTYAGMAPECLITSYRYESCDPHCLYDNPQDIEANYGDGLYGHGSNLATNSIGSNIALNGYDCSWEGDYEITAQLVDAISNGSLGLPFLSVWAAGNERSYGTCGTTYGTIGIAGTAKDNIVVGATNSNDHSMTYFSSWGPVDDGRLRPDVCAPGCQSGGDNGITSTAPGGGYTTLCGTSMATPAVSGVIALLIEQWHRTPGLPLAPDPATVKALLINTAQDYGNTGPDFQFGYGEIRPVALIDHLRGGDLIREGSIAQGEEHSVRVNVPQGQLVLKATLAWDDVPGELLALLELVNDLDLILESPTGQLTSPWILDPDNPGDPATRGADHRNPVEQVLVSNPAPGVWTLHVAGTLIPQGPQSYSLVANAPLGEGGAEVVAPPTPRSVAGLSSTPNPFSPSTTLRFSLSAAGPVSLSIYDSAGRVVRHLLMGGMREAGTHFLTWDGKDDAGALLPSGAYFYQVTAGNDSAGRKLLLVR